MRRIGQALLLAVAIASPSWAMEHYTNVLQDQYGRAIGGASVTVYNSGTATLATIYSDNGVTAKTNPFRTDAFSGVVSFYADNGVYDIVFYYPGKTFNNADTRRIALVDPTTITVTGGNTGTVSAAQGLDANFQLTGGNVITNVNEAKPLQIRGSGGQANNGVNIYQHSSGKLVIKAVVNNVEGDADIYDELLATHKRGIKDNNGNIIWEVSNDTGKVSAITMVPEDANVNLTLYQKLCGGDLVGVDPATGTPGHVWDKSPLGTAPTATAVVGTNRGMGVATFPDLDGAYGVQLTCILPTGWTGQLDAEIWWRTTGTGNARFQIATQCYASDAIDDAAFNTASIATATNGTSGRMNRVLLFNITATGCAANQLMRVRFFRDRTEASDTLNAALDVEKVELWARRIY